jgi:hypothetical protein
MSIDVLVHADPNPTPAPNPAMTFRAELEPPPRDRTMPAIPPNNRPAAPCTTIFCSPSFIVSGIISYDGIATMDDDSVAVVDDDDDDDSVDMIPTS